MKNIYLLLIATSLVSVQSQAYSWKSEDQGPSSLTKNFEDEDFKGTEEYSTSENSYTSYPQSQKKNFTSYKKAKEDSPKIADLEDELSAMTEKFKTPSSLIRPPLTETTAPHSHLHGKDGDLEEAKTPPKKEESRWEKMKDSLRHGWHKIKKIISFGYWQ